MKNTILIFLFFQIYFLAAQDENEDNTAVFVLDEVVVEALNLDDALLYEHRGTKKRSSSSFLINRLFQILVKVEIPDEYVGKPLRAYEVFLNNNFRKCYRRSFQLRPVVYSSKNGEPYERIDYSFKNIFIKANYKGKVVFPSSGKTWIPDTNTIFLGLAYYSEFPKEESLESFNEKNGICFNTIKLYPSDTHYYSLSLEPKMNIFFKKATIKINLYFKKDDK